ncbi:dual specificity phosphatase DUPD1-like isoform X3 [Scleropages formosus]|nr:dual specificity phosphatase DUPD1-like isoform X3 [Scleropages formosus]XP_029104484.1 dual specificity phosphatase DUPD1-like isoform X3 [Scleropages formosus]XP_029104485.1 dual specificity phosphatase DUPD1-like isoform X3 [Scleropages formosus]
MPNGGRFEVCSAQKSGGYETPSAYDLQRLMWVRSGSSAAMDEVRPRIYIGDMWAAKDKRMLQSHGISHVLNAADGKFNVCTGPAFYRDTGIAYHGVEAFDMPSFDMTPFFYSAARFIKEALSTPTSEHPYLEQSTPWSLKHSSFSRILSKVSQATHLYRCVRSENFSHDPCIRGPLKTGRRNSLNPGRNRTFVFCTPIVPRVRM